MAVILFSEKHTNTFGTFEIQLWAKQAGKNIYKDNKNSMEVVNYLQRS